MLAKRTTATVFSGAIALALYGCSLQDYSYLGAANGGKPDEETEPPDETEVTSSSPATIETQTSGPTDTNSGPDASVTTGEGDESEAGAPTAPVATSSSPATSETDTTSSTGVETTAPPDTTVVDETSEAPWVPGPVVVDPNNLLTGNNTNFETGLGSWTPLGNAVNTSSNVTAYTGSRSLLCQGRNVDTWEGPSLEIVDRIEHGKQYVVSGWVRTVNATKQPFHIVRKGICVYDGGVVETENADIYVQLASDFIGDQWTQLVTAPFSMPDCELQTFAVYFEGPEVGEAFYLDDVAIVEAP